MDWLTRMNAALEYIEANLAGEIDSEIVAKKACCSSSNFQRIFSYITDLSLADYIRKRRLTQAAVELQSSDVKVIDLALKYGYESPVSFSRAFAAMHGVTPTAARAEGVTLKAFPRISFQITIKGETEMDYRIETKEAFQVFGIEEVFRSDGMFRFDGTGEPPKTPHELWDQCQSDGEYDRLVKNAGEVPEFVGKNRCRVHGICDYRKTPADTFPYMLCAFRGKDSDMSGYTVADIPAYTWAIFPSKLFDWNDVGSVINTLYKNFFSGWLATAEYEQADGLNLEVYGGDEKKGTVELWFAVRKKV
ncbi:MAG TPA: effector binding domain-containing protein [Oscillospiraceae bacterium]|nr:effector binding domain-containing protein [Oscillospiraceae bacterium]HPF56707.1 effector binding domain-containing protein [Clostridiales bacterium]HPK35900.1 effector binding domain-containing protein [Oscillospiraceae bacterium]HPR76465.1 effector binding domain-containing protein [Oscillospiraceae bacterium]